MARTKKNGKTMNMLKRRVEYLLLRYSLLKLSHVPEKSPIKFLANLSDMPEKERAGWDSGPFAAYLREASLSNN